MPDKQLSKDEQSRLRKEINAWRRENGISLTALSRHLEKSQATVSAVLSGTYAADPSRHLLELSALLKSPTAIDQLRTPDTDSIVPLTVVQEMEAIVENARQIGTCAIIYGPSGFAKTTYAKARAASHDTCIYVDLDDDSTYSRSRLLRRLMSVLRIDDSRVDNTDDAMTRICNVLDGTRRVIFVDNAHVLSVSNLWLLHAIHDRTGCIMVCIGQPKLYQTLQRSRNDNGIGATIWRRFALKWDLTDATKAKIDPTDDTRVLRPQRQHVHTVEDVVKFLKNRRIKVHPAAIDWIHRLVNRVDMGGFGTLGVLLQLAERAYPEAPQLTLQHLVRASQVMSPEDEQKYMRDQLRSASAAPARAVG